MLMRDWRKGSPFLRWLEDGRRAKLLMALGIMCASYSVVIVVTLLTVEESDAPWLPANAGDEFFLAGAAIVVACVVGGFVHGILAARRARRSSMNRRVGRNDGGPKPLPGELNSYVLGTKWTLTGRRLWTFGVLVYAPLVPIFWLNLVMDPGESFLGVPWYTDDRSWLNVWLTFHCCFWMIWAFVLKGREVRRGKEQIKVADEYLAIRESRLNAEYNALCKEFLEQQQEWKARKTKELYEQILDQQARGILPCPNCHDQGEHRKSA